jgi:peptidoglycan hydrolase-like protein with peptidoglycan-binding domain
MAGQWGFEYTSVTRSAATIWPGGALHVKFIRESLAISLVAVVAALPAFATKTTHRATAAGSTHARTAHKLASRSKSKSHQLHGQQAIDSQRVTQIQEALIREHYLSSSANGQWDSATQAAMQKFQADQGWQTKLMPDSRALKKLGLGPDYSTAINAKDSSFVAPAPAPASSIPSQQAAGFAAAAGVKQ